VVERRLAVRQVLEHEPRVHDVVALAGRPGRDVVLPHRDGR
jgi:hypothetical protein